MRERRRFNQVRRIGFQVSPVYKRVYNFKSWPRKIQEELFKYQNLILEDSDYEDDAVVFKKYRSKNSMISNDNPIENPLVYITKNSTAKRLALEQGAQPLRVMKAKQMLGLEVPEDIGLTITNIAADLTLAKHALNKGIGQDQIKRARRKSDLFVEEDMKEYYQDRIVEVLQEHCEINPLLFVQNPQAKQHILEELNLAQSKLSKHPEILQAMNVGTEASLNLQQDGEIQHSVGAPAFYKELTNKQIQDNTNKGAEDQIQQLQSRIKKININSATQEPENSGALPASDNQNQAERSKKQTQEGQSGKYDWIKIDQGNQWKIQKLGEMLDEWSSGTNEEAKQKYENMVKASIDKAEQDSKERITTIRDAFKANFWYPFYDYICKQAIQIDKTTLDEIVPHQQRRKLSRKEQVKSTQWLDLSPSAHHSDNSLQTADFSHPLLIAKKKMYAQRQIPLKKEKPQRKPQELVNIDGKDVKWGDFQKKFYEDTEQRVQNGELFTQVEFLLNQGDPQKEKQLIWNYTTGFYSENSEDERTNLRRVERNFYKQRREKHSKPYLRERPIKQFELLMLKLGGKDILEKTTGKTLGGEVVTVYDWQDPQKDIFFDFGNFLLAKDKQECKQDYEKEKQMQELVMDPKQVPHSLFSHELYFLYQVFQKVMDNLSGPLKNQLMSCLPKSHRQYLHDINAQDFVSPPPSPKRIVHETPLSNKLNFTLNSHKKSGYPEEQNASSFDQFNEDVPLQDIEGDYNQNEGMEPPSEQQQQNESYLFDDDKEIVQPGAKMERIIQAEKPIFIIPKDSNPDYRELKSKLENFGKSKIVDDVEEIKVLVAQQAAIDPYKIEEKLIPRLRQLVEDSDGRIKGFFIWPHHRVDGESLIYPQGRRYPKRLRLYKHQLENKAIYVGGVEIGFLISNIPYMHAQALEGMGMPISQQTRAAQRKNQSTARKPAVARAAAQNKRQVQVQEEKKIKPNPKKRKADEALNLGVGMDDYHKDDELFKIEDQLPFLRGANKENCPFEVISIDRNYNNGQSYQIALAMKAKSQIQQRFASTKPISIYNKYLKKDQLKIAIRASDAPSRDKKREKLIDSSTMVPAGSIWNLTNVGKEALHVNIVLRK